MQQFPKIDGPCPLQRPYAEIVIGSHCALCNRTVHDLDSMDEAARAALLRGQGDGICVKYTTPKAEGTDLDRSSGAPATRCEPQQVEHREMMGLVHTVRVHTSSRWSAADLAQLEEMARLRKEQRNKEDRLLADAMHEQRATTPPSPACPRCGHAPKARARFCANCGIELRAQGSPPQ